MKALIVATLMSFGMVFSATASGNNTVIVKERANHLSDQMIRELRLNNYQSNEIREINTEVIAQLVAIETEFEGNQELIDQKRKSILAERDRNLENILSTVQYNNYFGKRPVFNKIDKEFVANLNAPDTNNGSAEASNPAENTKEAVSLN